MRIGLLVVLLVAACGSDSEPTGTPGSSTDGTVCERECDHNPRPECGTNETRAQCVQGCEDAFASSPDCTAEREAFMFCKLSQPASSFECDPADGTTVIVAGVCMAQLEALIDCL